MSLPGIGVTSSYTDLNGLLFLEKTGAASTIDQYIFSTPMVLLLEVLMPMALAV